MGRKPLVLKRKGKSLFAPSSVPHLTCDKIIFALTGVVLGRLMGAFDYIKL